MERLVLVRDANLKTCGSRPRTHLLRSAKSASPSAAALLTAGTETRRWTVMGPMRAGVGPQRGLRLLCGLVCVRGTFVALGVGGHGPWARADAHRARSFARVERWEADVPLDRGVSLRGSGGKRACATPDGNQRLGSWLLLSMQLSSGPPRPDRSTALSSPRAPDGSAAAVRLVSAFRRTDWPSGPEPDGRRRARQSARFASGLGPAPTTREA